MSEKTNAVGGNRILVVIFACLIGLMAGLIYTWSIWVQHICAEYGWGTDQVALMGNVMLVTFVFGVTIGGQLLPKLGAKVSCLIGSVMFGGFFIISSFVSNPIVMYVTYGVIAGLGVGILYVVGQFAASAWFPDKKGLIMGIFLAVFGLSVTICSGIINGMLQSMGVKSTMLIVGIIITVVCVVGSLFMSTPPAGWTPAGMTAQTNTAAAPAPVRSMTVGQAVKTKEFWFITIAYAIMVWPYAFISSYIGVFVTEQKLMASAVAVTVVSCTGIGSFLGRFVGGFLVDKLGCKVTYAIMCAMSLVACIALMPVNGLVGLCVVFIILCIGYGGRTPVYGVIYGKQFGPEYASGIYGWGTFGTAIFLLVAPLTTAAIRGATGSFNTCCIIAAVVSVVGCALMMMLPKVAPVEREDV